MIKANELRIGNYIMSSEIDQVTDIFCDMLNTKCHSELLYDMVAPIELTAEWLERFGFKKQPISYGINISQFPELQRKELMIDLNQGMMIREGDIDKHPSVDDIIVIWNIDKQGKLYIHQLQNLWFSLTGKELE